MFATETQYQLLVAGSQPCRPTRKAGHGHDQRLADGSSYNWVNGPPPDERSPSRSPSDIGPTNPRWRACRRADHLPGCRPGIPGNRPVPTRIVLEDEDTAARLGETRTLSAQRLAGTCGSRGRSGGGRDRRAVHCSVDDRGIRRRGIRGRRCRLRGGRGRRHRGDRPDIERGGGQVSHRRLAAVRPLDAGADRVSTRPSVPTSTAGRRVRLDCARRHGVRRTGGHRRASGTGFTRFRGRGYRPAPLRPPVGGGRSRFAPPSTPRCPPRPSRFAT